MKYTRTYAHITYWFNAMITLSTVREKKTHNMISMCYLQYLCYFELEKETLFNKKSCFLTLWSSQWVSTTLVVQQVVEARESKNMVHIAKFMIKIALCLLYISYRQNNSLPTSASSIKYDKQYKSKGPSTIPKFLNKDLRK